MAEQTFNKKEILELLTKLFLQVAQVKGLTHDKSYNTAAQPSLSEASADLPPENNGLSSAVPNVAVLTPLSIESARGSA